MLCPTCGKELQKLSVITIQGGRFNVDHCGFCGGTWFDPYEINRIPFHEVVNLANLTVLPKNKVIEQKKHLCPNDNRPLAPFQGEAVPKNVKLLWCKRCLGLWATQKDLWEFKKHQEKTISAYDEGSKFFPALSVVFVPALTFLFLLLTTFSTISTLQKTREDRIHAESQITNLQTQPVSPDSIIVSFNSSSEVKSSIAYGFSTLEMKEINISSQLTNFHNIILSGLKPGTDYLYRLKLTDKNGNSYSTDLKSFSTH